MTDIDQSQEERDFQAKLAADTAEIRQFFQSISGPQERFKPSCPYYRLAPEYFRIYLDKKPSSVADQALAQAFSMWRGTKGTSQQVEEALRHISFEDDVWEAVGEGIKGAFWADERWEEAQRLLRDLAEQVVPLPSRSALLFELAEDWAHPWSKGHDQDKARQAFEQIIAWDAHERLVAESHGHLYELDHLNPGQPAPHFTADDIDGHPVDIAAFRGRLVLLDFWASWCKPCHTEFPHLRQAAAKYPPDQFAIVSISLDRLLENLRACVEKEQLQWTHIWAGSDGWDAPLAKLFHVRGIPRTYLIDQQGHIAAKDLYQALIEHTVDPLLV